MRSTDKCPKGSAPKFKHKLKRWGDWAKAPGPEHGMECELCGKRWHWYITTATCRLEAVDGSDNYPKFYELMEGIKKGSREKDARTYARRKERILRGELTYGELKAKWRAKRAGKGTT